MFELPKANIFKKKDTNDIFPEKKLSFSLEEHPLHLSVNNSECVTKIVSLNDILTKKEPTTQASEDELYENNNGTALTIEVDNKLIIACDTRHRAEYHINSRKMTKIYRIGDFFLTCVGFYADGFELYSKLLYQVKQYEAYQKMPLKAMAHLLHNILYSRRFFPLFAYTTLSGYENGKALIYSYDCVGSYQLTRCKCDGSASSMVQPLLDSWINGKNFINHEHLSFDDALELVKKAFDSAAERDVCTKDFLEIYVVDKDNVSHEFIQLRKD